jgi:glycosyltransferase involved in cell wall biosynthesis
VKIAVIAGYYPPDIKGGGEISSELLAHILADAGCDVCVLTCGYAASFEESDRISVQRIKSPNIYWDFRANPSRPAKMAWHLLENVNPRSTSVVSAFLEQVSPDIVITSTIENFGAGAWQAAHEAGIPSVHILRSYYPFCFRGNVVKNQENCDGHCIECKTLSFGRKRASQHVNGIVGISRYVLDRHLDAGFFRSAATTVIGEPISKDFFLERGSLKPPTRFGYLGVLSADKGLESLAVAWGKVANSGFSLSIAGTGKDEYVSSIRQKFPAGTEFLGWVDSSTFLQQLDYLIVPSIWNEPFGRIVIEAFAKGVPVLGSKIAGIAETVLDGYNGYTFAPNNPDDMAHVIERSARVSPAAYETLCKTARTSVEAFESQVIADAHIAFYQRIIDKRGKGSDSKQNVEVCR